MTEAEFQRLVVEYAEWNGWKTYHTFDSRRSNAGFPDLVLVRKRRLLFVELKSEKGRVTNDQKAWLADLQLCPGVDTCLWRPSDWPKIEVVLR